MTQASRCKAVLKQAKSSPNSAWAEQEKLKSASKPTATLIFHHAQSQLIFQQSPALGSQFAGWRIKEENGNIAIGSGPARAIALKPKEVYEEIGYTDPCDKAVIVLESNQLPTDGLIEKVIKNTNVTPQNLIVVVAPTASIAGLTQVTGRVVEVGIHKLKTVGLDPKCNKYAMGYAPISPSGPDFEVAMARTNDAILYGGTVFCTVDYDDEAALEKDC